MSFKDGPQTTRRIKEKSIEFRSWAWSRMKVWRGRRSLYWGRRSCPRPCWGAVAVPAAAAAATAPVPAAPSEEWAGRRRRHHGQEEDGDGPHDVSGK